LSSPCEFIQADLADYGQVAALIEKHGPFSGVIHCAAIPGPSAIVPIGCDPSFALKCQIGLETGDPREAFGNNVSSSYNVFHVASLNGVRRVVFSSSAFAMGWSHNPATFVPQYLPLDEDHPMMPSESYGLSKQCCENIASMISKNSTTTFVSLRFTNVIHEEKVGMLPWATPTKQNPVTPVMWCYTGASDVAQAHLLALTNTSISGHEAFLLSAPNTRYAAFTLDLIKDQWEDRVQIRAGMESNNSIISSKKANSVLGWYPSKLWNWDLV